LTVPLPGLPSLGPSHVPTSGRHAAHRSASAAGFFPLSWGFARPVPRNTATPRRQVVPRTIHFPYFIVIPSLKKWVRSFGHAGHDDLQARDLSVLDREQVMPPHRGGERRGSTRPLRTHDRAVQVHPIERELHLRQRLGGLLPETLVDGLAAGVGDRLTAEGFD